MRIYKPIFWNKPKNFITLILLPISFLLQIFVLLKKNFIKLKNLTSQSFVLEITILAGQEKHQFLYF